MKRIIGLWLFLVSLLSCNPALAVDAMCHTDERIQAAILDRVAEDIQTQWLRLQNGSHDNAHLSLILWPNGQISDVTVLKTSGDYSFKLKTIQAVKQAAPLRKLPFFCEPYLKMVITLDYGMPPITRY